ncbi:MAG TPA: S9 family peptidase [Sphingobacteriaceae bacterium]|nr:S9 family peptidase [Sphingobacteriaceae bacterium]
MNLKHFFTTALALILVQSFTLSAQQKKELDFQQIYAAPPKDLMNALPVIKNWADNTHYIEWRKEGNVSKAYLIDVKTGAATLAPPAKANEASVIIKGQDIIYIDVTGVETKLDADNVEEKNPTLSPNGKSVAFTRNNDLYSIEISTKKETRYTTDGSDVIYNGWASWVYFEEILGRPTKYKAFWWSPDSKQIAYMRFDDSNVPVFPIYGSTGQHGYLENTRYPKAGDRNPEVKVGIVTAGTQGTVWTDFDSKADQYFGTPFWMADSKSLWVQWMNRDQNNLVIYSVSPQNGQKKAIYDEKQKTWIDWFDSMYFLKNGSGFILKSDKTGYGHFYYYDLAGNLKKQLTSGNWRVMDLLLTDEKAKEIYFTARKEATTRNDLYKVSLNGGTIKRLTFGDFDHSVMLSGDGSYFIDTYSNLKTPPRSALLDKNGKIVRELGNAKGSGYDVYNLPQTELSYYKTRDGLELPMTITKPLNFDPNKKYPVWISIYGGPDAGRVYDRWSNPLGAAWWAKEGVIQVALDNRSAGHLGKTGMNYIHRQMGKYEIEDYMDAANLLKSQSYVDNTKIGITGGSFGGYVTAMALTYGADVFTHGIANYSVTDWQLYDTHYTERFMDTPQENPDGYKSTSALTYAEKLKGILRIVHGTMDDNVHMQNSIQLVNKLQDLNKHFEFMVYPGERHGWGGKKARHSNQENVRFMYKYMLEKPVPEEFEGYWR